MQIFPDNTLLLFTGSFPYINGISEVFMENEIPVLAKCYKEVFIFPEYRTGQLRELPPNVHVVSLDESGYSMWSVVQQHPVILAGLLASIPVRGMDRNSYRTSISTFLRILYRTQILKDWLLNNMRGHRFVCYTYWFSNWATTLSVLKKTGTISHYISRTHGFDLYYEVNRFHYIPARAFQLKYVDKVFAVSQKGYQYLVDKHPGSAGKVAWSYLGTRDYFSDRCNPVGDEEFTLLSCSAIKEVKRVHLILELLRHVNRRIRWVHIGGGTQLDTFRQMADGLPENIHVDFRGQLSSEELFRYYQENFVHLFINVSSSEGLPVSVMEAISCGIPVIATDVGGTAEIVNAKTGKLIPADFKTEEVVHLVRKYCDMIQSAEYWDLRQSTREFWKQNFRAEANFKEFATSIVKYENHLGN